MWRHCDYVKATATPVPRWRDVVPTRGTAATLAVLSPVLVADVGGVEEPHALLAPPSWKANLPPVVATPAPLLDPAVPPRAPVPTPEVAPLLPLLPVLNRPAVPGRLSASLTAAAELLLVVAYTGIGFCRRGRAAANVAVSRDAAVLVELPTCRSLSPPVEVLGVPLAEEGSLLPSVWPAAPLFGTANGRRPTPEK